MQFALVICVFVLARVAHAQGAQPPVSVQAPASATLVRLFTPFNSGGLSVGLAVTDSATGSCFTPSVADSFRVDGWRCSAGNRIYDPCFENIFADRRILACADAPWTANVVLLRLTSPLPSARRGQVDRSNTLPWALELANGQRCTMLTGATNVIAGMRVNYGCRDEAYAVGSVDRTLPVWRIFFQSARRSISLDQVEVSTAWY
jgi:hypothetical protein